MWYNVRAELDDDKTMEINVSIRQNAKMQTVFVKCINEIGRKLIKNKIIPETARYSYELPNIWQNGGVGAAWFNDPFINITIQQKNGAWLAL